MTYAPLTYKLPRTDPYDRYYLVYSRRKVRKLYLPGFREVLEPRLKKAMLVSTQHRKLSSFLVERAKQRDDNADRASVVYFYRKKPKWITTADAKDHFVRIAR